MSNTSYPTRYSQERLRLLDVLGEVTDGGVVENLQHIGATSWPDPPGSACVDIALAAWPFPLEPQRQAALEALGYAPVLGYEGAPQQRFRHASGGYQLLIFEPGSELWANFVLTSQYLRQDEPARRSVAAWKESWRGKAGDQGKEEYGAARRQLFERLVDPARLGWIEHKGFTPVEAAARELEDFPYPWYVSGGWALDLFLKRVTRFHHDVDVVLSFADQLALQQHMTGRGWKFVTPFQKRLEPWPAHMRLELPRHQAHAHLGNDFIDFHLTDISHGIWRYRRSPAVVRTVERMSLRSEAGIPFLAPELVLLFKSKNTSSQERTKDQDDFEKVIALLEPERRAWLRWALAATDPAHPWIERLL